MTLTAEVRKPDPGREPDPSLDPSLRRTASHDEPKRAFLRVASHELRTPLNSILGFSDILAAEIYGPLGDPQYKQYAEIIRGSGHKLLKLLNQVLEIARLEAGVAELTLRPEPVGLAVDDALAVLKSEIAARALKVAVEVDDELLVMADPRGLATALGALLHNAVSYSPDGGAVTVRAAARSAPIGAYVDIVIDNDGEGVPPEDLARLMRPFEQGEAALTREGDGAGLGLPICQLTCSAMGGRLRLASQPGMGFTARMSLRAA